MPSVITIGTPGSPDALGGGTTADETTTVPVIPPQQGESEAESRLASDESTGISTGRPRFQDEDELNLVTRQAIQMEAVRLIRVEQQVVNQSEPQSATSSNEVVAQATNRTYVSQQRIDDAVRALQKLQRSCNHIYDKVSRRCLYCTKHRNSHVYDTTRMILNQS